MTRKAFIADVASAAAGNVQGVSQVVRGAEDGELDFCFTSASGQLINVHILALGMQNSSIFQHVFPQSSFNMLTGIRCIFISI